MRAELPPVVVDASDRLLHLVGGPGERSAPLTTPGDLWRPTTVLGGPLTEAELDDLESLEQRSRRLGGLSREEQLRYQWLTARANQALLQELEDLILDLPPPLTQAELDEMASLDRLSRTARGLSREQARRLQQLAEQRDARTMEIIGTVASLAYGGPVWRYGQRLSRRTVLRARRYLRDRRRAQ
jgi:hypothetical protein